jgi:hypothetical protein
MVSSLAGAAAANERVMKRRTCRSSAIGSTCDPEYAVIAAVAVTFYTALRLIRAEEHVARAFLPSTTAAATARRRTASILLRRQARHACMPTSSASTTSGRLSRANPIDSSLFPERRPPSAKITALA